MRFRWALRTFSLVMAPSLQAKNNNNTQSAFSGVGGEFCPGDGVGGAGRGKGFVILLLLLLTLVEE